MRDTIVHDMISEAQINSAVAELFERISFPEEPAALYEPLRYMISIGGKRIRPKLCLLAYSMFKDELDSEIFEPAAALEAFHSFTLLHDDIMDKSPLRRGMPTVWKKWGEDTAILSGDVMNIDSYRRIAMSPASCQSKVLALFTKTAAEVCEGQQYDMEFEKVEQVSIAEYMKMIGFKTAALLACSAKVGAIIAGADGEAQDALYDYGYNLGLAFQVADDFLDTYGDEKVFGKPIGGDIVNGKKSWLVTRALELLEDRSELFEAMELPSRTEEQREYKISAVKAIYARLGIAEAAKAEIARLTSLAMGSLHGLSLSEERLALLDRFADSLVSRAK